MGMRPGDEKILRAPLDWLGLSYYTRRIVSDPGEARGGGQHFGTEIETDTGTRVAAIRTRFHAVMPTEGLLTHAGLPAPRNLRFGDADLTRIRPAGDRECGCC
jgi:beta-glucosidase